MIKKTMAMMLLASTAHAGEFFEGYFYIMGAVPAHMREQAPDDFSRKDFRARAHELSAMWSEQCGARVFAWHTNLMSGTEVPFAPDMWVGILESAETREELAEIMPESACANQGYVRGGKMVIPASYQYCAFSELSSDYNAEICD